MSRAIVLISLLFFAVQDATWASSDVRDLGIVPNTKRDMTPAFARLFASCTNQDETIRLQPGRYDFFPAAPGKMTIAASLKMKRGLTLDGQGALFVYHGLMMPFSIHSCSNITLRNLTIDWERPFISQGEIRAVTETYVDIAVDAKRYPFVVENNQAWFLGEDWKRTVDGYNILYDKTTHEVIYKTRDNALGIDFTKRAEVVAPETIRFYGKPRFQPPIGTLIALNHGRYLVPCFDIQHSRDIVLDKITVHHALSHGVVASRTENLTLRQVNLLADEKHGRVFSVIADGFHLVHCKGDVHVEQCTHTGIGDDFLNIHGRNCVVQKTLTPRSVLVTHAECTDSGDDVWLLRKLDPQRKEVMKVVQKENVSFSGDRVKWAQKITFDRDLPADFGEGDFFENKTWNARLTLRNCRILKQHRARGLLVTTPEDVLIENNYFRTAGAAILIEGDTDYWFESGANRQVVIRNNMFEDCLTSGSETGGKWEWGEAIITVTPSHKPTCVTSEPYHRNIIITNNVITTFDLPLIRARSVRGLVFAHNTIRKSAMFEPFAWQKASFWLDGCREVRIQQNHYDPLYRGDTIACEHMRDSDLTVQDERSFNILGDL